LGAKDAWPGWDWENFAKIGRSVRDCTELALPFLDRLEDDETLTVEATRGGS